MCTRKRDSLFKSSVPVKAPISTCLARITRLFGGKRSTWSKFVASAVLLQEQRVNKILSCEHNFYLVLFKIRNVDDEIILGCITCRFLLSVLWPFGSNTMVFREIPDIPIPGILLLLR